MKLTKTEQYNILIEEFKKRDDRTLNAYDETLKDRLGKSPKTIERIIKEFMLKYNSIIEIQGRRRNTYKLITPIDLIAESFDHFEDIGWLFSMAHDADPKIFKELEQYTKKNKHLYMFKNTPFEDINTLESKQSFQRLRRLIDAREYVNLKFYYDEKEYNNLKCLKLVFMDNNWYVAFVDSEDILKFGRMSFIHRVDYGKIGRFQSSSVQKQVKFLDSVQNSMSLYGVKPKTAIIKATPDVAKYFEKDMKKFLSTQKYIKTLENGSVMFSISYTQELEVLPFIQKWLPDLVIQEPQELKEAYLKKLTDTINNHN